MNAAPSEPTKGGLVIDFQGPFHPVAKVIDEHGEPFATVHLFRNPDVSIFITSDDDADTLIAAIRTAKQLRRSAVARRAGGKGGGAA